MSDLVERQAVRKYIKDAVGGFGSVTGMKISKALKKVPSAEPEIIMCKDCKWKQGSECVRFAEVRPFPDDFCSRAERKENR